MPRVIAIAPQVALPEKHTYGQILKSSALIGGSQVMTIAIRIVRTKAMAVLLGPAGVGLMGVYESIANLAQNIAGLGINSSGVRQIAEAVGTGETDRIARTVAVLRRTAFLLGIFGALLLLVFSKQMSSLTFGNNQHTAGVALLSLAVFFGLVSGGQGALIQGMRRISDLARMGVLGTVFSTMISIPVVYFMGEKGVVPSLVGIAAMTIITSWWYSRKIKIQSPTMTVLQIKQEATPLLKLGLAFMASGFLMVGAGYAVRTMVLRMVGFEAAGLYQSAWALGGLYVGFILQAMGADFYPRLTAVATDHAVCNRLVNEQAQISLLLAGPGVLATMTFAPVVISLFYSGRFDGAVGILRWFCLGMTLRVITWPMGFIIVAKGEQTIFFLTELVWTIVNVGLSWLCLRSFGLKGAGIAFFGSYVFHGLIIYSVIRWLSGFRWSDANIKTGLLILSLIAVVFCGFHVLPPFLATGVGTLTLILSGVYSIRALLRFIPLDRVPLPVRNLLTWLRIAPPGSF
jgi:PST family polysaccharide transporter